MEIDKDEYTIKIREHELAIERRYKVLKRNREDFKFLTNSLIWSTHISFVALLYWFKLENEFLSLIGIK